LEACCLVVRSVKVVWVVICIAYWKHKELGERETERERFLFSWFSEY
jgi:hypothetical protein